MQQLYEKENKEEDQLYQNQQKIVGTTPEEAPAAPAEAKKDDFYEQIWEKSHPEEAQKLKE